SRRKDAKPNSDDVALAANKVKKGKGKSSNVTCYGCGRIGHIISECRDTAAGKTFTPEQKKRNFEHSQQSRPRNHRSHFTQEDDGTQSESNYTFMSQDSVNSLPPDTWLIDSATTKHIVRNKSHFTSYIETPGHSVTGFGRSPALGQGNATVAAHHGTRAFNITLRDALHVPDAPFNLISVGRMTQAGFTLKFANNYMSVYSPGPSSREVIRARRVGNSMLSPSLAALPDSPLPVPHLLCPLLHLPLIAPHLHSHPIPLLAPGKTGTALSVTLL
ncbi:hypothetical protein MPER_05359, partial [Moniliophthora perniciosa FA553]